MAPPAIAGTVHDPEVRDGVGDANTLDNSASTGDGVDTRPISIDSADLRSIWLETAFTTHSIRDETTGRIVRVENVPTALLVRVQTTDPIRPMPPQSREAIAVVRGRFGPDNECLPSIRAHFSPSQPLEDRASIWLRDGDSCWRGTAEVVLPRPRLEQDVTTIEVPLATPGLEPLLEVGQTVRLLDAHTTVVLDQGGTTLHYDQAGAGRTFVIGQDVPPGVDCEESPGDPRCAG